MQNKPLISIIIPVYNRANLLPDTLESIILQSQSDWECILVDDCSTDGSFTVMEAYQEKDVRFKIYKRPSNLKKGANSCRNYGFENSIGTYIKWFDSDDIMLPNHLERALKVLLENKLDFVVTDTVNFINETGELNGKPYDFNREKRKINVDDFAYHKIGWITDDFLGKRSIVQNIKFNEYIVDGDEYNFFIKMLQNQVKGVFLNEIVTQRRIHSESVSKINRANKLKHLSIISEIKFQTANDLVAYKNRELIRWFLSGYMKNTYEMAILKLKIPYTKEAFKLICIYFSILKGGAFVVALLLALYSKKGYSIMKYARS